jgi:hypothetical protein
MHKFSGPTSSILARLEVNHAFVMVFVKYKYVKASFCGMLVCDNNEVYWKIMYVDHINENALGCVQKNGAMKIQGCFDYVELEKAISCTYVMFEKSCNVTFYVAETMTELFHVLYEIKNSSWKVSQ